MSLDHEKLSAVAQEMMSGSVVSVAGKTVKVERTGAQKLRTVRFEVDGSVDQGLDWYDRYVEALVEAVPWPQRDKIHIYFTLA